MRQGVGIRLLLLAVFLAPLARSPASSTGQAQKGSKRAGRRPEIAATITFNKDIAPIIFKNCAPCHRPGEAGPFPLLNYDDVKKHAGQIAAVTRIRFMPPWLPEPGYGDFVGQRRLTDGEIQAIQNWAQQGAVEGDPKDKPRAPEFVEGWQLGKPDLVLKMSRAYELPAHGDKGRDVFRNFVIPVPVSGARNVKAIEFRPGNAQIFHHANILVDRTESSRRLDGQDGQPGFAGMDLEIESDRFDPDSHFLFWKPGTSPSAESDGIDGMSFLESNGLRKGDLVCRIAHSRFPKSSRRSPPGRSTSLDYTGQCPMTKASSADFS